jgi:hypothetical protein
MEEEISLSDLRTSLITDIREAWREEERELKAQEKADQEEMHTVEQTFAHHLVKIELGTVFVAAVVIVVMQKLHMEGLCEVGTLVPTCLLALFRIIRN